MGDLTAPVFGLVIGIDCLLSQQFRNLFERGFLLASQEQGTVAVADDGFPLLLKERLELCQVLQDDAD